MAHIMLVVWAICMAIGLAFCLAGTPRPRKYRPIFAIYDGWIGVYWSSKNRTFYWLPIPFVGLAISERGKEGE